MQGPIVVAYADTLFRADFSLDTSADSVIWVKQVEDPSAFGVVQLNENNQIVDFVEKPKEFVSDLAIIGIYYFKSGETLRAELQYLLDNNVVKGGEYQLTDALENMKVKGLKFVPGKVDEWMDCGNKNVTVETNSRLLNFLHADGENLVDSSVICENSTIIQPCFIGENVKLINATVGPNVSLGKGCTVENATIKNSLVQNQSTIKNANLDNAMIGSFASFDGNFTSISIGDYSVLE
jgi:glucose-1-phosphate thymidylyltransferase